MDVSFTVSVLFFYQIADVENRPKIRVSSFKFERCDWEVSQKIVEELINMTLALARFFFLIFLCYWLIHSNKSK